MSLYHLPKHFKRALAFISLFLGGLLMGAIIVMAYASSVATSFEQSSALEEPASPA